MCSFVRSVILLIILFFNISCGTGQYVRSVMGGGVDNTEPPSELVDFTETTNLKRLWSESAGGGTDELFIKLTPALLDNRIYVADTDGNIEALNIESGRTIWKNDTDLPVTGGPGADVNMVMVGTSEGEVISLSTEDGKVIWQSTVSSEILSSPRESDDVVVIRTIDGKIFALDAATGERLWVYDRTVPALTLRGTSTPVIANGLVIAGFDGGRVAALDLKTGKLIWEQRVAIARGRSELERMVDIDAKPLILEGTIYLTTFQANVTAMSLESGQILWQRDISSHSELAADGKNLYVTDDRGHIWAIDRFSGSSIWKQEKLQARRVTGPAILGNKIVVGDLEGYLHWLDKDTGYFTARTQISDEPIYSQAITTENMLFAYASDGTLAAYTYLDKDIAVPEQSLVKEKPIEKKSEKISGKSAKEEDEGSFFGAVVDIFTGDPDEDEEEEEVKKEEKKESSKEPASEAKK